MKTITKKINLNVNQPNNYQLIHAMQGDNNTVEVIATIWNGNTLYNIDTDKIALEWQSPSGNKKDYPIKEHTTNTATFVLKSDMLVENGDYTFCIRFDYDNNDSLRTFCSIMKVSKAPFGQLMETEVVTITELVNQTKEYYNKLISEKGKANGIATLDANTKVPINELYEATTSNKGITQLEDSTTSNSTTNAATPNSVKTVNDALTAEVDRATKAEEKLAPLASPTLTGTPTAPTASTGNNTTQIATTAFVQTAVSNGIAASDAMIVKGTIGTNGTVTTLPTTYKIGWTYRVVTAGTYAGQVCEIGDLIIALIDRNGSGNTDSDWCVAQTNINGAITSIKSGDAYISCSQSGSVVTIIHKDVARTDTTSTDSPSNGGTFTVVDDVTSDNKGHITNVNTKTVTLPTFKAENITPESIGALPENGTATDSDKVDGLHASSFLGNGTGYAHPGVNGGDANNYKTEFHGFVYNMSNIPNASGNNYGFLDVSWFNGFGFVPSTEGVVLQRFTHWTTGYVYTRTYGSGSWTSWKQLAYTDSNVASANKVLDSGDSRELIFAYSKDGMNYGDYTWLAGWNGNELRAVSKEQFATKSDISGINNDLSNICAESVYISIPYHTATIDFMRIGNYCMAHIEHHCTGESWETRPYGKFVSQKYIPSDTVYFRNTSKKVLIDSNGDVSFFSIAGVDYWEYGYVMYQCAN